MSVYDMVIETYHHYELRATCIGHIGFLDLNAISVLTACKLSVGLSPDVQEQVGTTNLFLMVDQINVCKVSIALGKVPLCCRV